MYPPRWTDEALPEAVEASLMAAPGEGRLELPVLPEATATILAETSREDWQATRVLEALKRDPALAAHLLRVANSPAFRGGSTIVSVQQAVSRLGAANLRKVAVVIACETRAFRPGAFTDVVRAIFKHSLATGLFAREIARHRRANVEEAFLAGLLHDLGWPVALQAFHETCARLGVTCDDGAALFFAARHHGALGATVARAWKLPEPICQAIASHLQVHDGSLGATVAFADLLARRAGGEPCALEALRAAPQVAHLNLYPDAVDGLAQRSEHVWAEAAAW